MATSGGDREPVSTSAQTQTVLSLQQQKPRTGSIAGQHQRTQEVEVHTALDLDQPRSRAAEPILTLEDHLCCFYFLCEETWADL